jgi:hypothetical protein
MYYVILVLFLEERIDWKFYLHKNVSCNLEVSHIRHVLIVYV